MHNFQESLARSASYVDAPWWTDVYRQAFPGLQSSVSVRDDGWAQRGGIDRVLTLECGRTVTIDEKVREKDWPDFCLEYWSDRGRKIPGWVAKDLACDFIAYAFAPSKTCYLLPFLTLRQAWRQNGRTWVSEYKPPIVAHNDGWETVSVAVPIDEVLEAIGNATIVKWGAND